MSALLFDAGNTRLKWASFSGGELGPSSSISLDKLKHQGLNSLTTKLPIDAEAIMVSNVAGPTVGSRLAGMLSAHCNAEVRFARTEAERFGLRNAYAEPRQMGVDRWVAMIGAWTELSGACIVVDAGTALTIDAINDEGEHLGGQILPGIKLMLGALGNQTSDLPDLADDAGSAPTKDALFAGATVPAIKAGAWSALTGAVNEAFGALANISTSPQLVLTGGDAPSMLGALPDAMHRPQLVLSGLARLLEDGS